MTRSLASSSASMLQLSAAERLQFTASVSPSTNQVGAKSKIEGNEKPKPPDDPDVICID